MLLLAVFHPDFELPEKVERFFPYFAFVVGDGRIGIAVEFDDIIHKLPDLLVRSVENMCTVLMYIDALNVLTIDISTQMIALIDDQTTLTLPMSHARKRSTIYTGSNDQIIILFIHNSLKKKKK